MSEAQIDDGRRVAKIYFKRGSEALVKDLAASIRNQKSHAHLIDQQHFTGPDTVLEANAVLIQATAPKARLIGRSYAQCGTPGTEVLFFDGEGKITQMELTEPEESFATLLGVAKTDTGGSNDEPENTTERPDAGILGEETPKPARRRKKRSRPADAESGDSTGNAESSES